MTCEQELCPFWAGDAGCPCQVLGISPALDATCDADFVLFRARTNGIGQLPDRIVCCALPQGHSGPHFDGLDQRWEDSDIKPWTPEP